MIKKTLFTAVLALASTAMVYADYTWTGAAGDGDWHNEQNWDLGGATWAGTGPMTSGSDMWSKVIINNGDQVTVDRIEGWEVQVDLSNGSSLTIESAGKMQGNANITVQADAGVYTETVAGSYKDHTFTFNVYREGGVVLHLDLTSTSTENTNGNTVVNLGAAGSMTIDTNISGGLVLGTSDSGGRLTLSAELVGAALTLGGALAEYEVVSRDLLTLDGVTFSGVSYDFGEGLTLADAAITAENAADNVGKYFVSTSDTGVLSVSYVRLIPEPTVASLSLLALAGLAARRRRK